MRGLEGERIGDQRRLIVDGLAEIRGRQERNVRRSAMTAAAFDQDQSFMLVEVGDSELFFETISRTGATVDQGVIRRETSQ